jgi:hypothetical protein
MKIVFLGPISSQSPILFDFLKIIPHDVQMCVVDDNRNDFALFQNDLKFFMSYSIEFFQMDHQNLANSIPKCDLLVNCDVNISIERVLQVCITKRIHLVNSVESDSTGLETDYSKDISDSNILVLLHCSVDRLITNIARYYTQSQLMKPITSFTEYQHMDGVIPPTGKIPSVCHSLSLEPYFFIFHMHLQDRRSYYIPCNEQIGVTKKYLKISKSIGWIQWIVMYMFVFLCQFFPAIALAISNGFRKSEDRISREFIGLASEKRGEQTISTHLVPKSENYTRIQSCVIATICACKKIAVGIQNPSCFGDDLIRMLKEFHFEFAVKNSSFRQDEKEKQHEVLEKYVYLK